MAISCLVTNILLSALCPAFLVVVAVTTHLPRQAQRLRSAIREIEREMIATKKLCSSFNRAALGLANRSLESLKSPGESWGSRTRTYASLSHGIHVFHCPVSPSLPSLDLQFAPYVLYLLLLSLFPKLMNKNILAL